MSEKTFNTRVKLKYDTLANWTSNNPVLLSGEVAFVEVPSSNPAATTAPTILIKVGDGNTHFNDLGWTSALAADVYDWAKSATIGEVVLSGSETISDRFASISNSLSELSNAEYDAAGSAATAESNAKAYADTVASSAETNAKAYADSTAANAAAAAVANVVANADASYDTLKEIADWIQSDTTGAAKMASDIGNLQSSLSNTNTEVSNVNARVVELESSVSNIQAQSTDIDALTQQDGYVIFNCGSSSSVI